MYHTGVPVLFRALLMISAKNFSVWTPLRYAKPMGRELYLDLTGKNMTSPSLSILCKIVLGKNATP